MKMTVDFTRFGLAILVIGMFDTKVAEFGLGHFERLIVALALWFITGCAMTIIMKKYGVN
jgi:hypothetical protein